MDTEMKNAIQATDQESQYDEKVKRLLGHKHILAHILVKAVSILKENHILVRFPQSQD